MLSFMKNLMIEIGPDDSETFDKKTENDALSALKVAKIDEVKENKTNKKDELLTEDEEVARDEAASPLEGSINQDKDTKDDLQKI